MSNHKKNFVNSTRSLLLLKEPYEMTYWKEKLNSPFHRLQMAVKNLWMRIFNIPHYISGDCVSPLSTVLGKQAAFVQGSEAG